ncbi:hypothetical protein [Geothrix terrae]|uniref:hypothetical protein n=1 Tax=Geothrix terrae TaxID=2922720 RepID=UPI001FAD8408|nr:hypothetical protein [Geothrix terrae]
MRALNILTYVMFGLLFFQGPGTWAQKSPQPHTLTLQGAYDTTFSKLLVALVNNDSIILTANQQVGVISFRNQSEDAPNNARKHVNVLEGTILVKAQTPHSTVLQVKLTLAWQESYVTQGTYRTGVQKEADDGWYKGFLDMLSNSLAHPNE